jgi:sarcosine oxidase gamma subunit
VSALAFLSPGAPAAGVVDVRGDDGLLPAGRVVRLTPRRAFVLCDDPGAAVREARERGLRAYDLSGAFTVIRIDGDALLRRLTEVEVAEPLAAPVANGVRALIVPLGTARYELYVPRELADHVGAVAADLREGLR